MLRPLWFHVIVAYLIFIFVRCCRFCTSSTMWWYKDIVIIQSGNCCWFRCHTDNYSDLFSCSCRRCEPLLLVMVVSAEHLKFRVHHCARCWYRYNWHVNASVVFVVPLRHYPFPFYHFNVPLVPTASSIDISICNLNLWCCIVSDTGIGIWTKLLGLLLVYSEYFIASLFHDPWSFFWYLHTKYRTSSRYPDPIPDPNLNIAHFLCSTNYIVGLLSTAKMVRLQQIIDNKQVTINLENGMGRGLIKSKTYLNKKQNTRFRNCWNSLSTK